jgi:hypothetical protein
MIPLRPRNPPAIVGHASETGAYLLRQADALYQQGDERGDNDALRSSIGLGVVETLLRISLTKKIQPGA